MTIYLLRHAETESNKQGALSSISEDPLTVRGHEQAKLIVEELMNLKISRVLCSLYPRAIDTVSPFLKANSLKIELVANLAEGQLVLDSKIGHETPEYFESAMGKKYPIANETAEQFLGRAIEVAEMLSCFAQENVLVVSHGHMIRELLNIFQSTRKKTRYPHDNCGLSCIELSSTPVVKFLNHRLA